ncbi:helix-turn-helix domain-containing protein [Pseudonocardia spirodelae]|uniref:Helix-turn-helix transcriptional regulator n=1 Tax=Pseudonocardia spirodelae TaxID=3133431 RepID=A0ABU8T387_9PSEU
MEIDEGDRLPDEPPAAPVDVVVPDLSGVVRRVRRSADLSQRELAARTGLAPSTIARIESRSLAPALGTLAAILAVAGLRLVVVDAQGRRVPPMEDPPGDDLRDGAGRRFPAHLDVIVDPLPGEWWGDRYGCARPPETFRRDRELRDVMRRRSVWEVRVAQQRAVPPPPTVEYWMMLQARCRDCGRLPEPPPPPFDAAAVVRYLRAAVRLLPALAAARAPGRPRPNDHRDVSRRTHRAAPDTPAGR